MVLVPVVVRPMAPRSGSTQMMGLLGTSPLIAFDRIPPFDRRYLRYLLARCQAMVAEEGSGPTLRGGGQLPADPQIFDLETFVDLSFKHQWEAFSEAVKRLSADPAPVYYAERDVDATAAVDIDLRSARIPLRLLWLIRDPRDVWASVNASRPDRYLDGPPESERLDVSDFARRVRSFSHDLREGSGDGLRVRFEDLVLNPRSEAERLGEWLGVDLEPDGIARYAPTSRPTARPEDSIGRWQRDLPSSEQRSLNAELADVLEDNGYG